MKSKLFFFFLIFIFDFTNAQWKSTEFPAQLNIQPFTANFLEPRTGVSYLADLNKLRLDIGASHDILHMKSDRNTTSMGVDFFTYTRLRKQDNFKFPVETIDYMFGVNLGYKIDVENREAGVRFRFSHISAHLVDGLYEENTGQWKEDRKPFVYSKEFIEIFPYYKVSGLRIYLGVSYNFHIVPEEFKKGVVQIGMDYFIDNMQTEYFIPFFAYDFKISGYKKYGGTNSINAGIKFGNPTSRGLSILISFISGKNVHGELYDMNEQYFALGFNLDI